MTISQYLNKLYKYLGGNQEELAIDIDEKDERIEIFIDLPENEVSLFIGTRGETLNAFETILRSVFHKKYADKKIMVDINDYRKKKEVNLQENAVRIAYQVLDTGRSYVFSHLNSYERYLIHAKISEEPELVGIETFSEDEEDGRVLVVQIREGSEGGKDE